MMREGEVNKVTWCPGKKQLADCMTKRGAASWDLMEVFRTGRRNIAQVSLGCEELTKKKEESIINVCDLIIILLYFTDNSGGLKYMFTDISMVASEQ